MTTKRIRDIRTMLAEDFNVQTKTESYLIPGSLPVEIILPVEDWSMRSMALAEEATTIEDTPEAARRLTETAVDIAGEGHELALKLIRYNQPEVTLDEVKRALPTMEAISIFFDVIFEEYRPEVEDSPSRAGKPAKGKGTTRTIKKTSKSKPKKSQ
jgi:hypothetical protein